MGIRVKPRVGLANTAYEHIKRDIIRCELAPGLQISRAQLDERYRLGQAAIREALNRLSQDQLVQAIPHEGYVIAPITLKQAQDLFGTRLIVETVAARMAAGRIEPDLIRRLDDIHVSHYHIENRDDLEAYVRTNSAFHMMIARASGNERIGKVIASLLDEIERLMHLTYLLGGHDPGSPSHEAVVEAVIAGDGERAAEAMATQIRSHREFVLTALYASPNLQGVNLGIAAPLATAAMAR